MRFTRKIRLDRIGSSTSPAKIGEIVEVSPDVVATEGAVIAVRALSESKTYGDIELPSGRPAKVVKGNLIAGVLGSRQALHGYMGHTPSELKAGDTISMLNMGGVMGINDAPNKDLGPPIALEVLGAVVREGEPLNIHDFGLPVAETIDPDGAPIVMIMGTSMNSGKTYAAAEIIRIWSHSGVKVAAGKLTGVAALRDTLRMQDNGAFVTGSFLDCGLPSTVESTSLGEVSRSVVAELDRHQPEVIVLELGDGIIGGYNTDDVLRDEQVRERTRARVFCAGDLVGAWGGVEFLERFEQRPQIISGPVTDNEVGTRFIKKTLDIDAFNARLAPLALAREVAKHAQLDKELFE